MKTNYRTDKTIRYNREYDVELIYNAISDVYMVRTGSSCAYFDRKDQALDAYYDELEELDPENF